MKRAKISVINELKRQLIMATTAQDYTEQLHKEIEQTPEEYRGLLLRIVHSFREGVTLPTAEQSVQEGWQDVMQGNTRSVDTLWDDMNK